MLQCVIMTQSYEVSYKSLLSGFCQCRRGDVTRYQARIYRLKSIKSFCQRGCLRVTGGNKYSGEITYFRYLHVIYIYIMIYI